MRTQHAAPQLLRERARRRPGVTFEKLVKLVGHELRELSFDQTPALLGPAEVVAALKKDRLDIVDIVSLKDIPSAGAHNVPLTGGSRRRAGRRTGSMSWPSKMPTG